MKRLKFVFPVFVMFALLFFLLSGKLPELKQTAEVIPTKMEAIEAINKAFFLYDISGLESEDVFDKIHKEKIKTIIESFPSNWKAGLMIVRFNYNDGSFGCDYFPLIKTQSGYIFASYYLKGVEIKEVNRENIYLAEDLSPVCMAESNPIAIWRSSGLWKDKQNEIWNDNYWKSHGEYNDPDLLGAEWLKLP